MNEINDLTLAGLFSFLIAGLILGGFLSKVKDPDIVLFYTNILLETKNRVVKRHEMYAGGLWLFLGTALQIAGYFKLNIMPLCINLAPKIIIFGCCITFVLLIMTPKLAYRLGSRERRRLVIENAQRENLFESAEKRIEKRQGATEDLNQLGEGIDIPRKNGESDEEYLRRLRPFFSNESTPNK